MEWSDELAADVPSTNRARDFFIVNMVFLVVYGKPAGLMLYKFKFSLDKSAMTNIGFYVSTFLLRASCGLRLT
jgi:hypothetical protein